MSYYDEYGFKRYVSVSERRTRAARAIKRLRASDEDVCPVTIEGRGIAKTFWGRAWCENLERYRDYENRLPRGRTYVRSGAVLDLQIADGRVEALVLGSELYMVRVEIAALSRRRWRALKEACAGGIDSLVGLLRGELPDALLAAITAPETGMFPTPREIEMDCSCPDWAVMCKHVAAALYGVGARLDDRPELFFAMRGVDQHELISDAVLRAGATSEGGASAFEGEELASESLSALFGIELEAQETRPARIANRRRKARGERDEASGANSESGESSGERRRRAGRVRAGQRLTLDDLQWFGMSRSTVYRWAREGTLDYSTQRGCYRATPQTRGALQAYLDWRAAR